MEEFHMGFPQQIIMILIIFVLALARGFGNFNAAEMQRLIQLHQESEEKPVKGDTFMVDERRPPSTLLNIDYIFSGYNLFLANPLTYEEPMDPGFTGRPIFEASYSEKRISMDGKYKLPDGVQVMNKKGCKFSFDAKIIRTKEDFQKHLSGIVGLNLAANMYVTPWAFTASLEYNYMQEMIEQRSYQFPLTHATCTLYHTTLDTVQMPPFTKSFIQALKSLPKDYDPGAYIEFYQNYGTHYLKSMILGSRMGMVFTMPPEQMQQNKGDRVQPRWRDEEIELAAKITAQFVKGVINTQILPRNQSSKAFTDLTKVAVSTSMIEVGPQPTEASQRAWAAETETDPMPVKYQLGGILEMIQDGKGELSSLEDREKLVKNMKLGLIDYCGLLSVQNQRYGPCQPTTEMYKEQIEKRPLCLQFFEQCDYAGQSVSICGSRNPVQNMGLQYPEVTAAAIKFYSENPIVIGTTMFTIDYDQSIVMQSFHNDFLFFEKSEQCESYFYNAINTRVRVYITDPKRCMVVLLWNYCPGYAVRYFTSVLCNQFDVNDNFKAAINEVRTCEVAILDIRFPMSIPLRICLFKNSKLTGERVCFGSEIAEQFYGQSFRSMLIDETEVVVHKAMPASITVHFSEELPEEEEASPE